MKKILPYLDIYQTPIYFSYKGRKLYPTYFGVFLTLCTIILFILSFTTMGSDMIYKTNPTIISKTIETDQRPWQHIGRENFTFSFIFSTSTSLIQVPPEYFNVEVGYFYQSPEFMGEIPLPTKQCNISYFTGFEEQFQLEKPPYYLSTCVDQDSFELGGFWTEKYMKSLYISVNICQNSTESNITCASIEEIEKLVKDELSFIINFSGKAIDITNYENPIRTVMKDHYWTIDLYTYKNTELFFKQVNIETDDGFLLENKKKVEDVVVERSYIDLTTNHKLQSPKVLHIFVYSSEKVEYHLRTYKKIQDVVAQIGGILNVIIIFCKILVRFYSRYPLSTEMINEVFDLEEFIIRKKASQEKTMSKKDAAKSELIMREMNFKEKSEDIEEKGKTQCGISIYNNIDAKKQGNLSLNNPKFKDCSSDFSEMIIPDEGFRHSISERVPNKGVESRLITENADTSLLKKDFFQDEVVHFPEKETQKVETSNKISRINLERKASLKMSHDDKFEFVKSREKNTEKISVNYFSFYYHKFLDIFLGKKLKNNEIERKNLKFKYFEKADSIIQQHLDADFIVKKMIEIDQLKAVIFDEEQLAVFNYISKPKILLNENEELGELLGDFISVSPRAKISGRNKMNSLVENDLDKVIRFCNKNILEENNDGVRKRLFKLIDKKIFKHMKV